MLTMAGRRCPLWYPRPSGVARALRLRAPLLAALDRHPELQPAANVAQRPGVGRWPLVQARIGDVPEDQLVGPALPVATALLGLLAEDDHGIEVPVGIALDGLAGQPLYRDAELQQRRPHQRTRRVGIAQEQHLKPRLHATLLSRSAR